MKETLIFDYDGTIASNIARVGQMKDLMIGYIHKKYKLSKKEINKLYLIQKENNLKNINTKKWVIGENDACYYEDEIIFELNTLKECFKNEYENIYNDIINKYDEFYKETVADFGSNIIALRYLKEKYDILIVSNSSTEKIESELKPYKLNIKVIGNAKKYNSSKEYNNELFKPLKIGERIIEVNRPYYNNVLNNFDPKITTVIGDNFSLDLALPFKKGFKIILVENSYNKYAFSFVKEHGLVVNDLKNLVDILGIKCQ
jgi:hypothetical protein